MRMIKSLLLLLLLAATTVGAALTYPYQVHLLWDLNPPEDNVTNYTISRDGTQLSTGIVSMYCMGAACSLPVMAPDANSHSYCVDAINSWGSAQSCTTAKVSAPGGSQNVKITK